MTKPGFPGTGVPYDISLAGVAVVGVGAGVGVGPVTVAASSGDGVGVAYGSGVGVGVANFVEDTSSVPRCPKRLRPEFEELRSSCWQAAKATTRAQPITIMEDGFIFA